LEIFGQYWGILGPFLGQILGEVGRWLPTLGLYKPGLLEAMGGDSEQVYAEYFPSQSHFYAGKILRSTPLWAISWSSDHPISVSFLLLGSRDLVENKTISFF
jgi:hypothetical protein